MLTRVTIHHEGAGVPSNHTQPEYTYWVGVGAWTRIQSPYTSWATKGFNHMSVDVCLSGNRMVYDVTDNDLQQMRAIAADTKARGELVAVPNVYPHRQSFNTACPGDKTMARWADVAACFTEGDDVTPDEVKAACKQAIEEDYADPNSHLNALARRVNDINDKLDQLLHKP